MMIVRLKNRFGRRYISHKEFLQYAQELDLFVDHPSKRLLEFAERYGLLTPVARIRFPGEVARRWYKDRYPQEDVPHEIEGDTSRLQAATSLREEIYKDLWGHPEIYGERPHPLDDVAPEHTPFIQTEFETGKFTPWSELRAIIALRDGKEIGDAGDSVRTCYHYWQVFELAALIRSGVAILYGLSDEDLFRKLFNLQITESTRRKLYARMNLEARHELNRILEHRPTFDAVAYFEAHRKNALQKHVHSVDRATGRLPVKRSREYRRREKQIARETLERFDIKPRRILQFIEFQCDLWDTATRRSPAKVAEEYSRNILSTIALYRLVTRATYGSIVDRVGKRGRFKPILKEIFPDWIEEQRDLAERSLKSQIVPLMSELPPPFAISDQDIMDFCDWVEQQGLLQLYWHFKRFADLGVSNDPISQSAIAAEAIGFTNAVELLANAILEQRNQSPRGRTLLPKVRSILVTSSPSLFALIKRHAKLTDTRKSTLKARIAQIDRLKKGGADAPVARAILKLVVIRNEGTHLGLKDFEPHAIYKLVEALIEATLIIWKGR